MRSLYEHLNTISEASITKTSSSWYYENIKVPGIESLENSISSDKDSTKIATALVNFWEKNKSFEQSGLYVKDEDLRILQDMSKLKISDVIKITILDNKQNKDYSLNIKVLDKNIRGEEDKHIFVKVSRIG